MRAAAGDARNILIRGRVAHAELVATLQAARAFVYAAEEDFGIGMVEAQACGTPLLSYARGGAADIVTDGETGVLFRDTNGHRELSASFLAELYSHIGIGLVLAPHAAGTPLDAFLDAVQADEVPSPSTS